MADEQPIGVAGQDLEAADQIRRLLKAVREKRFRMVLFAALFAVVGGAVAVFIPDLYESRTLLLLREAALIDDSVLLKAIQDKTLAQKERTLAQELTSFSWVNDVLRQVEWVEYAEARGDRTKLHELVNKVRDPGKFQVQIETDTQGELMVELIFKWYDPQQAHDYVLRTRKNWVERRVQSTQKYWTLQLQRAEKILLGRQREYAAKAFKLQQFQTDHDIALIEDSNVDNQLLANLRIKRSDGKAKVGELEVRIRSLQEQRDATEKTIRTEIKEKNPAYQAAEAELLAARSLMRQLLESYKDTHPKARKQRRRVEELTQTFDALQGQEFDVNTVREEINPRWQTLDDELALVVPELDGLREQLGNYESQFALAESRMAEYPVLMSEMDKLTNERTVAKEELNSVLKEMAPLRDKVAMLVRNASKLYTDSEEELKSGGGYEILEDPIVPKNTTGLPKAVFPLAGLVLGALLSLALSLLAEVTRSTYEDAKEVHRGLMLPVLGGTGNISTVRERRRLKARQVTQMAGGVLIVVTLGALVYVITARTELLPLGVQSSIEDLRSQFK